METARSYHCTFYVEENPSLSYFVFESGDFHRKRSTFCVRSHRFISMLHCTPRQIDRFTSKQACKLTLCIKYNTINFNFSVFTKHKTNAQNFSIRYFTSSTKSLYIFQAYGTPYVSLQTQTPVLNSNKHINHLSRHVKHIFTKYDKTQFDSLH